MAGTAVNELQEAIDRVEVARAKLKDNDTSISRSLEWAAEMQRGIEEVKWLMLKADAQKLADKQARENIGKHLDELKLEGQIWEGFFR